MSEIFSSEDTIETGIYDDQDIVRAATIAQKFKAVNLVLYDKYNTTILNFYLKGKAKDGNTEIEVSQNYIKGCSELLTDMVDFEICYGELTKNNYTHP